MEGFLRSGDGQVNVAESSIEAVTVTMHQVLVYPGISPWTRSPRGYEFAVEAR